MFPDYEYSKTYVRMGIEYSAEKTVSGDPFEIQNEAVRLSSKFDLLEIHSLGGGIVLIQIKR